MRQLTVFCIEGSGVSSSGDLPLTYAVIGSISLGEEDIIKCCSPFMFRTQCKKMVKTAEGRGPGGYLFVAKSLGAYRLYKHRKRLMSIIGNEENRIGIVTVDPHAPFWLCGPGEPIDGLLRTEAKYKLWNVFQSDRYPRGASVLGANNIHAYGTDHTDIIRTEEARDTYHEAVSWVRG